MNNDGLKDLVCMFSIPATGFQKEDATGFLRGKTLDGTPLFGHDFVKVVQAGAQDDD